MSYVDNSRPAPFGAITIFRLVSAATDAADRVLGHVRDHARSATEFSPAQREDIGLSVSADARPGLAARAMAAIREWSARHRTIAELSRLSDAQLEDIGLTRGHIEALRLGRPLA